MDRALHGKAGVRGECVGQGRTAIHLVASLCRKVRTSFNSLTMDYAFSMAAGVRSRATAAKTSVRA